jgi:hypothetical protein
MKSLSPGLRFLPILTATFCVSLTARAALVTYYPLDETSGNMANDSATADGAQNATAGVAASDWQISAGILGGAVRFSPTAQTDTDEAFVYTSAGAPILSGVPFSLSIWIKTSDISGATHAAVFFGDGTAFSSYYALGSSTTHQPQIVARNTTAVQTNGSTLINDGQWHHLAGVYSATNARSLYLDGKVVATNATDVPQMTLNRIGLGALTRSTPTDSYAGLLDEVGLFDTTQSAAQVALLNAFPRFDNVKLNDTDFDQGLAVFTSQTGSVTTGNWQWSYATGLTGTLGTTGTTGVNPFVVLDSAGNGLRATAVPEPSTAVLAAFCLFGALLRRRAAAE